MSTSKRTYWAALCIGMTLLACSGADGKIGVADAGKDGSDCVPGNFAVDPDNCGACAVVCSQSQVCSGGTCAGSCLPGLTACNRTCADLQNDNKHCGACGTACPAGQGCVSGKCANAIPLGPDPDKCKDPPLVTIGGTCLGNLAQTTFRWGLCSCKNVSLVGASLDIDAYDSKKGPYMAPGLPGGGLGLNGSLGSSSSTNLSGAMWASAAMGITSSASNVVDLELHSGGPVTTTAKFTVGDGAFINGNVTGSAQSSMTIAKALTVPMSAILTNVVAGSTVRQAVTVPPPCECETNQLVPVASYVAKAAASNDNALIGLSAGALATQGDKDVRLDLPCGVYYLKGIDEQANVTVYAHGRTAVLIEGDVVGQDITFMLDANAELDVFITGTINYGSGLIVGSPNYPARMRMYIAASANLALTADTRIAGNFYAAYAKVAADSNPTVYGAIYAGDFTSGSNANIHYDRAVLKSQCPPPPGTCGSCKDCGNQACINGMCGPCGSSSDCCAPLICQNGSCVVALN